MTTLSGGTALSGAGGAWIFVIAAALGGTGLVGCSRGKGTPPETGLDGTGGSSSTSTASSGSGAREDGGAAGETGTTSTGPFVAMNPNCDDRIAAGDAPLIDDFEDGDDLLDGAEGRDGGWWASSDETENSEYDFSIEALDEPRDDSTYGAHASGSGMADWGAVFAVTLRARAKSESGDLDETECAYDASVYTGVRFWARGEAGALRVKATMMESIPVSFGGICAAVNENDCWNDHGASVTFSDEWVQYSIPFEEMMQDPTWGIPTEFNAEHIDAIRFQNDPWVDFDFWIDDLTFY